MELRCVFPKKCRQELQSEGIELMRTVQIDILMVWTQVVRNWNGLCTDVD